MPDATTPEFIYGTAWKEEETARLTRLAIETGFRAIDTANQRKHYYERGVGEAIRSAIDDGVATRDDLFLQTKFTHVAGQGERTPYDRNSSIHDQVTQSLLNSLDHLGTKRVDSLVLHGPSTRRGFTDPDREAWESMAALSRDGRVGVLGVSNVTAEQLETLLDWADRAPAYVQNRCFARAGWDREVRTICDANDVVYQGFSLLTANARELADDAVAEIAERHDATVPQIVFRFATQVGMIPLTGTTSEEHMRQDLAIFDFELDRDELDTIENVAA